jgi:hypothetical protein
MAIQKLVLGTILLLSSISAFAKSEPQGESHLWSQHSQPIKKLDMFWGSGGERRRPVGPYRFISENMKGTNPKIWVTDSRGVRWSVKFDEEVHAEVAASRFFWAAGFVTDDVYFVPSGVVTEVSNLQRAAGFIDSKGRFKDARFETEHYSPEVVSTQSYEYHWKWEKNPFVGSKELSALKILNTLISNFDTKTNNNSVEIVRYKNGRTINWYVVSDLGGTFGRADAGGYSKWKLKHYVNEPPVGRVYGRSFILNHLGKNSEHFGAIPLEHARWFYDWFGKLDRSQIEDAFRAAFSAERVGRLANSEDEAQVKGFSEAFSRRLHQLGQDLR